MAHKLSQVNAITPETKSQQSGFFCQTDISLRGFSMIEQSVFLRTRDILKLLGIKRSTWNNWVKKGQAPAGLKLSSRIFIWKQEDIEAFLEAARQEVQS